jgi:FkbM family methyltransferase
MDLNYILRRFTFALEVKGIGAKINQTIEEFLSMGFHIRAPEHQITWMGPKGDLKINYYDSIGCFRAEIVDLKMLDTDLENKKDPLILDLGANQGLATLWFKYNYPGAKITAYEPLRKSFDIVCKNVQDNNFEQVSVKNFGVLDKDCIIPFYHIEGGAGLGDSVVDVGGTVKEDCRFCNLDPEWEHVDKIDLIKIDIEGSEYPVLKNCKFWKKADKMIIEFHDNFKDQMGYGDIDFFALIMNAGFKVDKKVGEGAVYVYYFSKVVK